MANYCKELDLKPQIYITAMEALSVITIPTNMLALYCIVMKSPKQMDVYKWYLFTYQFVSTVFDSLYSIFLLPVVFFPVPMGCTFAWLAKIFSLSTYAGFCMVISLIACLSACILTLFSYRLNVIVPKIHIFSLSKLGHVYLSVGMVTFSLLTAVVALVDTAADQTEAKLWVTEEYSCAEPALSMPRLYVFLLHKLRRVVIVAAAMGIVITALCIGCVILSFHFIPKNGQLSQKTKMMQRRFLIYLCVQASIPTVGLTIPVLLIIYSIGAAVDIGQGFANCCMFLLALHGTISSITVVLCNEPYRKFAASFVPNPFDWAYTILLLPVLFFPVPMGHTAAWLAEIFSIPTYGGFCFCASILGCLAAIILNLFGYRLNVIVPKAHVLSLTKLGHAYMSVAVAAFCIICVAIALIDTTADQADAISWVTRVCYLSTHQRT
ncbi:hypothetical protein Q1695_011535 [Nippostrongylus brasiliensis]|nr:hypothetical protein Q1695_011535 [Nippostrongylus brasiliensis]